MKKWCLEIPKPLNFVDYRANFVYEIQQSKHDLALLHAKAVIKPKASPCHEVVKPFFSEFESVAAQKQRIGRLLASVRRIITFLARTVT